MIPDTTSTDPETRAAVAVLPVGSFEQHGPYLPLATDTLIASAIADSIHNYHTAFRLPPITFGCSHEHSSYPGTVSISAATLIAIIEDITKSLTQQGINGLLIVNAHGGNAVLTNIVQQANHPAAAVRLGLYPSREDWTEARTAANITSSNHDDMHAGELETSILLANHPASVRNGWENTDHTADDRRYLTTLGIDAYTDTGVIGYPSRASAAKGQKALEHLGHSASSIIELLTKQSAHRQ